MTRNAECMDSTQEFNYSSFRRDLKLHLQRSKSCRTAITSDSKKRDQFGVYLPVNN
jgi:hypothetical protein